MTTKLFISYSRQDGEFARRLVSDLIQHQFEVWLDQSDIQAGDAWRQSIVEGIDACDTFIIVISPRSMASRNVAKEVSMADDRSKRILPIVLERCEIPKQMEYQLTGVQHIDFASEQYQDAFNKLVSALTNAPYHHAATTPEPSRPAAQGQPSTGTTPNTMPTMQPFPQFTPQTAPTFNLPGNYQVYISFPYPNTHLMAMYGQQSFNAMGQFTANLNTTQGGLQMQGTWQMAGAQIMLAATCRYTMMPMNTWFQPTTLQVTGMGPAGFTTVSGTGEMVVFQRMS